MGLGPTQGDEKRLGAATTLYATVALSFVIPSVAEGSAVPSTSHQCCRSKMKLSSQPKRTQISCRVALDMAHVCGFR